jgi:protein-S-isoprenylcysteine O-methyltransferase Ste14
MNTANMHTAVSVALGLWVALEVALLVRDLVSGQLTGAHDRGTLVINWAAWIVAFFVAGRLSRHLDPAVAIGSGYLVAALILILTGLVLRVWAITVLGSAFRTSVQVEDGQHVVDTGPYRWIRHPSYTGILLISVGAGLSYGNWIAPAVLLLIPLAAIAWRISVEEAALTRALGERYAAYRQRTNRLVPRVW